MDPQASASSTTRSAPDRHHSVWLAMPALLICNRSLTTVVLHWLIGNRYGIHRDELATLEDARHLAWGYPAYPPVTPFFGGFPSSCSALQFAASASSPPLRRPLPWCSPA